MVRDAMNEYIFYTTEGCTLAPDEQTEVDNCQVLGRVEAVCADEAWNTLLQENPWIADAGYCRGDVVAKQLVTDSQRADIMAAVECLVQSAEGNIYVDGYARERLLRAAERLRIMCR